MNQIAQVVCTDAEREMFEWLARADEIMKDDENWLDPFFFDRELNDLLLQRQNRL